MYVFYDRYIENLTSTDRCPVVELYCSPSRSSGADLVLQHEDAESERAKLQASPPVFTPILKPPLSPDGLVAVVIEDGLANVLFVELFVGSFEICNYALSRG